MAMQAVWQAVSNGFMAVKSYLVALILAALLVLVGDRGSAASLRRNSPCLAVLCIFAFTMGMGLVAWFLVLTPLLAVAGENFNLTYPLLLMYWAFWLLVGVLVAAKKLVYDSARRREATAP